MTHCIHDEMNIVLSIFHSRTGDNYTFVHGIFPCPKEAEKVAQEVRLNPAYVMEEGYEYDELQDRGISVTIVSIPMGVRVNAFVEMEY